MEIPPGVLLAFLIGAGFVMQWLAWKIRVPAILPLLVTGIVLGPVLHLLDPDALFGSFLFPGVSLAVAVILFEGSLTLRLRELRDTGHAVRGLITYGALAAVVLLAAAAHWIAGIGWGVAFLFGALTCITGPTVITPLLRTLRPVSSVASALRWEGIVLDPIGALLAVLVFQAIITQHQGHSVAVFLQTVGIGAVIGVAAAAAWGYVLFNQLVPEYLQNYGTLAFVLAVFSLADGLATESGLLAVTIMGIWLGNSAAHVERIMSFKEDLSLLLVSLLFIVLAARLHWPLPDGMLLAGILVFLAAQFVIRPATAWLATLGSPLSWRERALIGFVAPRGVVAAAVSSLFALRLRDEGNADIEALVPLVFILIIATVVLQSLASRPLARLLGVAAPEPDSVLIFGANKVARTLASALHANGIGVVIADEDWTGISQARMAGLATFYGNPVSRHAELKLDLTPIGWLLAVSRQRELNHLVCTHYQDRLDRDAVYRMQIIAPDSASDRTRFAHRFGATPLFGNQVTLGRFEEQLDTGWTVKSNELTETFDWQAFRKAHGDNTLLLFGIDPAGRLHVANDRHKLAPRDGWTVAALVPPPGGTT